MGEEYTEQEFKEKCWFVYGIIIFRLAIGKLVYSSEGKAHSVEFDWEKGLSKILIGWFHSHPQGCGLYPSFDDERTMKSWVRTIERPLICGIMHKQREHGVFCYLFKREANKKVTFKPIRFKLFKNFFIGIV